MTTDDALAAERKARTAEWFEALRDRLTAALEAIELEHQAARPAEGGPARFERKPWSREGGGGGVMGILKGRVFEKAGVNVSTVHGEFAADFRAQIPGAAEDPRFSGPAASPSWSIRARPWCRRRT